MKQKSNINRATGCFSFMGMGVVKKNRFRYRIQDNIFGLRHRSSPYYNTDFSPRPCQKHYFGFYYKPDTSIYDVYGRGWHLPQKRNDKLYVVTWRQKKATP
jgi:hypothetical protein